MIDIQYMDSIQLSPWTQILQETRKKAFKLPFRGRRFVIFSDFHMGNGGSRDDFRKNADPVFDILSRYYYPSGHHLILNGDIEELQKFQWEKIHSRWASHYRLFQAFNREGRFSRTVGNHDIQLHSARGVYPLPLHESLSIDTGNGEILIYHGHQFSELLMRFEKLCRYTLQYIAYPLGIMNYSKSPTNRKKLKTEIRAYEASSKAGLISIIGHTHRPLFESLSKTDSLRYRLDFLIRSYRISDSFSRKTIEGEIRTTQRELSLVRQAKELHISKLYSAEELVPCLFNSGCAIGKRGMTAIEIDNEKMELVYWYDSGRSSQYRNFYGYEQTEIPGTPMKRVVLNSEKLSYIQDKIRFMAPRHAPSERDTALPFLRLPN
jgi:UDP-2,3-diacylglucosamine pyrophosphatase LpxH